MGLHKTIANAHPSLRRGVVWCKRCGRSEDVRSENCLHTGWPECCGETMTIDSPDERKHLDEQKCQSVRECRD